ncbi:DUF3578 domain-containing protein [Euryarchaeota archaeon]|nr:DUF3578 domain-containing protein [Euryarchaeota archaeon]
MNDINLGRLFADVSDGWHAYLSTKKVDSSNILDQIPTKIIPALLSDLNEVKSRSEAYVVKGSGGKGNITQGPHIEIMNGRITTSPQSGYYVVYLFSADMERLYLSLAFGVTAFKEQFGEGNAHRNAMQRSAEIAREPIKGLDNFPAKELGILNLIDSSGTVVYDYQFSNIAAIKYDLNALPDDSVLIDDLSSMLDLYEDVLYRHGISLDHDMQTEIAPMVKISPVVMDFKLRKRRKTTTSTGGNRKRRFSKSAQKTGYDGERMIFEIEKSRLIDAGREDLASKVQHLAAVGKTPGYDIESYTNEGLPRRIEVKSGVGSKSVFELTRNEKTKAEQYGEEYVIAIVERLYRKPTVEFILNPAGKSWWGKNNPSPLVWEVDLRESNE